MDAPPTLVLVAMSGVAAGALGAVLARLARRGQRARRAVEVVGYLAALPTVVWLLVLYPQGELGSLYMLSRGWPVALALALPLAALVARIAVRPGPDATADWTLEGWLFASWLLSAVAFVEVVAKIPGVGFLLVTGAGQIDMPLLAAATAVLSAPLLFAGAAREFSRTRPGRLTGAVGTLVTRAVPTDVTGNDASEPRSDGGVPGHRDVAAVLRTNRRVQAGLGAFAVLFAVGTVGRIVFNPFPLARGSTLELTLLGLGAVTAQALVAGAVGLALGLPLGLLAARRPYGRGLAGLLVDYAVNVPLLVFLFALGVATDRFVLTTGVPELYVSGLTIAAGLPVAGLVARAVDRELSRGEAADLHSAAVPALAVGAIGAAVATMVLVQAVLVDGSIGLGTDRARALVIIYRIGQRNHSGSLVRLVRVGGVLVPPVLSLLLLGEGLRWERGRDDAAPTE